MDASTESLAQFILTDNTSAWLINNATLPTNDGHEFSQMSKIALTIIISIVTVMGLVGNTIVIFIVMYFPDMHTVFNFSFANLALTDLMMLLLDGIPTATDTIGLNFSAKLGCMVPIYLQYVSIPWLILFLFCFLLFCFCCCCFVLFCFVLFLHFGFVFVVC